MAITDLTGTTWVIHQNADLSTLSQVSTLYIYIKFTSNGEDFAYLLYYNGGLRYYKTPEGSGYIIVNTPELWDQYRTITITGNSHAWDHFTTNQDLISWLQTNADLKLQYYSNVAAFMATADAIRAKTGSNAPIEWKENGFADAIAAIQ